MSERGTANDCLVDYFRCPREFARLELREGRRQGPGYFRFGADVVGFGKCVGRSPSARPGHALPDLMGSVEAGEREVRLPFDPAEMVDNLRRELYTEEWRSGSSGLAAALYYLIRPLLGVAVRKHLQKFHLRDWHKIAFPRWPVDCAVDDLMRQLLQYCVEASPDQRIPVIWFWPDGFSAAAVMTHDVEATAGRDFCSTLADVDEKYGVRGSYQVIPEERYAVSAEFLDSLRKRGCEIAVHDLNHDGHLYKNREQFLHRAEKINSYLKDFRCEGFRAGVLYRKQIWFDALECAFDMSVPNVAHLDPQRGGCCTVMPYFIGKLLEIPVTMAQDYTLFNILNDYSIDLWKRQAEKVLARNGLMSFIVHPDYVVGEREMAVYEELLGYISALGRQRNVWITTPGEVNRWWRERAAMRLAKRNGRWHIEGQGSERARLAWATVDCGRLDIAFDEEANARVETTRLRAAQPV
jgi:hypothetical protein